MKTLTKTDVKEKKDELTPVQEASFLSRNEIEIRLMEPGDVLVRMISQKHRPKYSPFWIDEETTRGIFSVIRSSENYSMAHKKEMLRNSLAVLDDWTNLSWRIKIEFKRPVIAYYGKTGAQKNFDTHYKVTGSFGEMVKAKEHRIGGFHQYVIPSFQGLSDEQGGAFAEIRHFAHL